MFSLGVSKTLLLSLEMLVHVLAVLMRWILQPLLFFSRVALVSGFLGRQLLLHSVFCSNFQHTRFFGGFTIRIRYFINGIWICIVYVDVVVSTHSLSHDEVFLRTASTGNT